MNQLIELHITLDSADCPWLDKLVEQSALSKTQLKQAMHKGALWLTRSGHTQRLRRVKKTLQAGDQLHLYYNRQILEKTINEPTLIADEQSYSVWYKPYGVLSQGSKWGDHCTLQRYAETNLKPERPAFTVHRLDRAAQGLMLLGHSKTKTRQLSALFQSRDITKCYQAIVAGELPEETITVTTPIDDKPAHSKVSVVEYNAHLDQSLLDIQIQSGRKHQIRRHLSELGFPIIGDRLYGANKDEQKDLQLLAYYLAFNEPESEHEYVYRVSDDLLLRL